MVKVHTDKFFINKYGKKVNGFYLDGILKNNIDKYFIRAVKNDLDGIAIISGCEGGGKTTMASTLAYYCDPSFPGENCERIVFSGFELMKAIDNAKEGQAIILDEAILSMGSQDHASFIQKVLIKKFVTIRKKNLFIFLILPSFFMLRKYFAIFRTRFLLHTYMPDGVKRGFFGVYNRRTKRLLFIKGLKEMDMQIVKPNYRGRFTDTSGFFYNMDIYESKKDKAISSLTSDPIEGFKKGLLDKYNLALKKVKEYQERIKIRTQEKERANKSMFRSKILEVVTNYRKKEKELKNSVKIAKSGKIEDEIKELVNFRDKMLFFHYGEEPSIKISVDLKDKKIISYTPRAIENYLNRGKSLIKLS